MTTGMTAVTDTGETRATRAEAARPRRLAVMLGVSVAVVSLLALAAWRAGITRRAEPTAPGEVASPTIQTPAPATAATKQPTSLTATSPDATVRAEDPATAAAEAKPIHPGTPKATSRRPAGGAPVVVAHPAAAPAAGGAPAPAPAAPPDCAHPFFVDSDGIKKFRPECM
jgi:hypothetical protein